MIEGIGPQTAFARLVGDALGDQYFTLLDIGCSGGIDDAWRAFGNRLRAFAFDPNIAEVNRLARLETSDGVTYVSGFIGVPAPDPAHERFARGDFWARNPWGRLSAGRTAEIHNATKTKEERAGENRWHEAELADPKSPIIIPEFLQKRGIRDVDFIKIDVDGPDFLILQSLVDTLRETQVLGVAIEVNFFGSDSPGIHTFHNVDRLLKGCGFEVFALSTRQGSVAALPAPYRGPFPSPTAWGRILQGDALYFRDAAAADQAAWASSAGPYKLAKVAALFSLAGLPDCAAEVVQSFRQSLQMIFDVDASLDALVRQGLATGGPGYSYPEYLAQFEADASCFYPPQAQAEHTPTEKTGGIDAFLQRVARGLRSRK